MHPLKVHSSIPLIKVSQSRSRGVRGDKER